MRPKPAIARETRRWVTQFVIVFLVCTAKFANNMLQCVEMGARGFPCVPGVFELLVCDIPGNNAISSQNRRRHLNCRICANGKKQNKKTVLHYQCARKYATRGLHLGHGNKGGHWERGDFQWLFIRYFTSPGHAVATYAECVKQSIDALLIYRARYIMGVLPPTSAAVCRN